MALTADLNGDKKPDVYVVCGGATAGSFKQVLFMSQASAATYVRQETSFTLQQAFGASAGDIDGDGNVDLVVTDNGLTVAFMNDGRNLGAASFVRDDTRIPTSGAGQIFPTLHRKVFYYLVWTRNQTWLLGAVDQVQTQRWCILRMTTPTFT